MLRKILTFYLCDKLFGIDITLVKEINRNVEYTYVPEGRPFMAGMLNMRGQVVSLLDLSQIILSNCDTGEKRSYCIILKNANDNSDYIGFLIDRPGSVLKIDSEFCESLPANIDVVKGYFLKELIKSDNELIMIIDYEKIINIDQYMC